MYDWFQRAGNFQRTVSFGLVYAKAGPRETTLCRRTEKTRASEGAGWRRKRGSVTSLPGGWHATAADRSGRCRGIRLPSNAHIITHATCPFPGRQDKRLPGNWLAVAAAGQSLEGSSRLLLWRHDSNSVRLGMIEASAVSTADGFLEAFVVVSGKVRAYGWLR